MSSLSQASKKKRVAFFHFPGTISGERFEYPDFLYKDPADKDPKHPEKGTKPEYTVVGLADPAGGLDPTKIGLNPRKTTAKIRRNISKPGVRIKNETTSSKEKRIVKYIIGGIINRDLEQILEGIATQEDSRSPIGGLSSRLLGLAFGAGALTNNERVLKKLEEMGQSAEGLPKEIVLDGFSRGAVNAIMSANEIYKKYGNKVKVHLVLSDPVPGPLYNNDYNRRVIPPNIVSFNALYTSKSKMKKLNRFFQPISLDKLTFTNPETKIYSDCLKNSCHRFMIPQVMKPVKAFKHGVFAGITGEKCDYKLTKEDNDNLLFDKPKINSKGEIESFEKSVIERNEPGKKIRKGYANLVEPDCTFTGNDDETPRQQMRNPKNQGPLRQGIKTVARSSTDNMDPNLAKQYKKFDKFYSAGCVKDDPNHEYKEDLSSISVKEPSEKSLNIIKTVEKKLQALEETLKESKKSIDSLIEDRHSDLVIDLEKRIGYGEIEEKQRDYYSKKIEKAVADYRKELDGHLSKKQREINKTKTSLEELRNKICYEAHHGANKSLGWGEYLYSRLVIPTLGFTEKLSGLKDCFMDMYEANAIYEIAASLPEEQNGEKLATEIIKGIKKSDLKEFIKDEIKAEKIENEAFKTLEQKQSVEEKTAKKRRPLSP